MHRSQSGSRSIGRGRAVQAKPPANSGTFLPPSSSSEIFSSDRSFLAMHARSNIFYTTSSTSTSSENITLFCCRKEAALSYTVLRTNTNSSTFRRTPTTVQIVLKLRATCAPSAVRSTPASQTCICRHSVVSAHVLPCIIGAAIDEGMTPLYRHCTTIYGYYPLRTYQGTNAIPF